MCLSFCCVYKMPAGSTCCPASHGWGTHVISVGGDPVPVWIKHSVKLTAVSLDVSLKRTNRSIPWEAGSMRKVWPHGPVTMRTLRLMDSFSWNWCGVCVSAQDACGSVTLAKPLEGWLHQEPKGQENVSPVQLSPSNATHKHLLTGRGARH